MELAKDIRKALMADLDDRIGLGFDGVDDDVMEEIEQAWDEIIAHKIKAHARMGGLD